MVEQFCLITLRSFTLDILEKIAVNHNIPVEQLIAVVFHSDEWSEVEVYGSEVVASSISADLEWSNVSRFELSDIKTVPNNGRNFASEIYGVAFGRVLIVHGLPK